MSENIPPKPMTPEEIREKVQSQGVQMLYYNYARTAASFFDVRIFYGQGSVSPKGEQSFEEQLCVIMSPEFAKTFRDSLVQAVAQYEATFGEIKASPTIEQAQKLSEKARKAKSKNKSQ